MKTKLANIRREYGDLKLTQADAKASPFEQFECWLNEAIANEPFDPTAMVIATVDTQGRPDTRIVLLKGIHTNKLIFYTHFSSMKAQQLDQNKSVAVNFYWPSLTRQVRIRGVVAKVSDKMADDYFATRPKSSQLSVLAAQQSTPIANRETLEANINALIKQYQQKPVMRPKDWGGYQITPDEFEFWQGRDNRLHDRLRYRLKNNTWMIERLAP